MYELLNGVISNNLKWP